MPSRVGFAAVGTADCGLLGVRSNTIDYVFTDPPFGENIY